MIVVLPEAIIVWANKFFKAFDARLHSYKHVKKRLFINTDPNLPIENVAEEAI